jgi:hypothetical protein
LTLLCGGYDDYTSWINRISRCERPSLSKALRLPQNPRECDIFLSDDAIERYIHRYQQMLAARHHDPQLLTAAYAQVDAVILAIDGLQPEKGHETLYVVRELERKRVWFAEALLSSATAEIQQLLVQARTWAERLGKPVRLWMSDKQEAFVQGIAAEFPGVPHRYCANHFLRDVAKPVLEVDSHAKVKMRRTIRGLRTIEREVLAAGHPAILSRAAGAQPAATQGEAGHTVQPPGEPPQPSSTPAEGGTQDVVLAYWVSGSSRAKTYGKGAAVREHKELPTLPRRRFFGKDIDERSCVFNGL